MSLVTDIASRTLIPAGFTSGVFPEESDEIYFRRQLGVASNSVLKILDGQTPGHYLHYVRTGEDEDAEPVKDTESQLIGKAFHCLVLEGERFRRVYREEPDFGDMKSAKNRARREEWLGYQPSDRVFLRPKQMKLIHDMRESLMRHKLAVQMLEGGRREVVFRWIDPETGVACKSKVDLWDEELGFYLDLKSCLSAHPTTFGRTVASYRYHVQHCMYATGAKVLGFPIRNFLLVPVEKIAPHFSAVYHIDAAAEEKGWEVLRRSLAKMRACMDHYIAGADLDDAFPAYGHGINTLTIPGWAFAD